MKNSIEKLLTEMTNYFSLREFKVMKKAIENMTNGEIAVLVSQLMNWLALKPWKYDNTEQYSADYWVMSEIHCEMFTRFTTYCPQVSDVFVLDVDRVKFNPKLTKEEIQEIIDFVDENYDAPFSYYSEE